MMEVENVTEAELSDLRQKFQLLEGDRKAYYEMSMHTMKENKKMIVKMRDNNKALRKKLANVQRQTRSSSHTVGEHTCEKEIIDLEKHVMTLRKNHDMLKSTVDLKRQELKRLRDEASALELEARRPNAEDSPLARKIRTLENRLDKAMIKYNEAQSIRKTYEQIVKRLKEERVGFDNQLSAVERTLQAKQHDLEELLLLSGDANHAKDIAQQDLDRARNMIAESRKERDHDLREKKDIVNTRSDMVSRLEKREQMRNDIIAKANGDLGEQEEKNLKTSLAINQITHSKIVEDTNKQRAKIDIYEDAFRKIKDATGVSDVNEVIQKIISQEDTQRNLKDLTRENQEKIEHHQGEKQKLALRVEEIKYSGNGGGHRRKMVDDHEENLAQSVAKLERCRLRYERLAKILINVKAGVDHLADKLESVQQENKHIVMNDDTVVDVLVTCENTLCLILSKVNQEAQTDATKANEFKSNLMNTIEDDQVVAVRRYNQRVALPDFEDHRVDSRADEAGEHEHDSIEMGLDDDGEEELTRDRIKKASHTIVQTHEKKSRRKRKSGAENGGDGVGYTRTTVSANGGPRGQFPGNSNGTGTPVAAIGGSSPSPQLGSFQERPGRKPKRGPQKR